MRCADVIEWIAWYPTEHLTQAERVAMVRHTAGCPQCRAELVRALTLARSVRRAVNRLPPAPPSLRSAVLRTVSAAPDRTPAVPVTLTVLRAVLPAVTEWITHPLVLLPPTVRRWLPMAG